MDHDSDPPAVEFFDFATATVRPVALVQKDASRAGFSVSSDGRWVLYAQIERETDIMLVENFR